MSRVLRPLILIALFAALVGCGEDDSGTATDAAPISLADATPPPPDATPTPDAFVCTMTECGGACVDTTSDPDNCGDCGMACETAGQLCVNSACECPPAFVPTTVEAIQSGVMSMGLPPPNVIGFGLWGFGPTNIIGVTYDPTTVVAGEAVDIATIASDAVSPNLVVGYDLDLNDFSVGSALRATAGELTFNYACADGVSITATNVTFTAVEDLFNPVPAENGCTFEVAEVNFAAGTECPTSAQGGN